MSYYAELIAEWLIRVAALSREWTLASTVLSSVRAG
jgi:hypothetical protein